MPLKFFCALICFIVSFPAWPVSFDWSGWTRVDSYFQRSPEHSYYGSYHLILQPSIHVIDGVRVTGRLDLSLFNQSASLDASRPDRQTGFVFIDSSKKPAVPSDQPLFFRPSQIYIEYQNEFLKLRLGRAPYHFGLGAVYSASQDPFQHWISAYNQAVLYVEYSQLYVQPGLLLTERDQIAPILQAGLSSEDWSLEAFYQYSFKDRSFAEAFGKYEKMSWSLQGSASYVFADKTSMLVALEAFIPSPFKAPFTIEIKTGAAIGDSLFHPNYDVALLFWNRLMSSESSAPKPQPAPSAEGEKDTAGSASPEKHILQIASGQIQKGIYFSPRLLFSFWDDRLKIRPLFLLARDLNEKRFNYEFDLEGIYQIGESLFFSLTGGAFYTKKLRLALLAQAAVSF